MALPPRKTYPELSALTAPVVDSDVVAFYRTPGPLRRTTATVFADYIKAFFSASGGSALVSFLQSGTGAIARTLQARGRDVVYASDFGVTADGSDEAPELRAAITAASGKTLLLPCPSNSFILCNSSLGTIPANTYIRGENKRGTVIRAGFDSGSLMRLADGAALADVTLDGNSRTCKGVEILGTDGNQYMNDVRIVNFANDCLYFALNAGSGFNANNLEAQRSDGASGSGNYAIVIEDAAGGLGPKHFFGLETGGTCAFSFGGGNNVFVIGSTLADCEFSVNNQSIHILGGRIANATTMNLKGSGISIIGGDANPEIILDAGVQSCNISPAAPNNSITDNSGNSSNLIFEAGTKPYTPVVSTSGGSVTIGDGDISGSYQRTGTIITGRIDFIVGSSTVFNGGGGILRFTLPLTPLSVSVQSLGTVLISDASSLSTPYTGIVVIEQNQAYLTLTRDTSGQVTTASPIATLATGDTFGITFSYSI